ncbi:Acetyl-CoA acetyltransferase [Pseudovibrio sp. FO-BEG1]|uniref:Beta-ketothiolase n=1 Tax=Pseudovibrio denitrificans TaxID=258256 RepID=A0A1I7AL57_9HYPH|nr:MULTISPECIES: acetyl-CoA C-acetyltransferase [Pseudovibrio]AEV34686.1 Acetyl-CoA acetyltransferase [Pseudovibrio sp. FO-BEG1]EEA93912.1 acetyl-CoA acetyltransferase [Pseudovibrio sp. JE062]SFT75630.1 acetyl-CoA acetyltransferase [Pseudovibrio denitrificans]
MTSPNDVVIVSATRTPIGSFNGSFANTPAQDLGTAVIKSALDQAKVEANDVNEVIFGHVLTSGLGQNPARQAALNAGMADDSTAIVINQVCGSGLRAVAMGMQQIQSGDADIIVAGGQENMTLSPHCQSLRAGVKMGDYSMTDTMLKDGLIDAFQGYHMGITAENIAEKYQITREAQDEFAVSSQNKAEAALKAGKFKDEITPITVKERRAERVVEDDEYIRVGANIESMQKLRPAFKKEGTVTAANASGINDGAAALVLMSAEAAEKRGLTPLATIKSWATAGVDPAYMGLGPIPASKKALEKAGWSIEDLDLVEANEAFAAQALAVGQELGIDSDKLNVNGGAIALGHPIGASGARVLVTLLHEMKREEKKKGLATLCIGGGMGIALCVERK